MNKALVCGMICSVAVGAAFAQSENVFSYPVGDFTVHLLVENQGEGKSSILIGADAEALKKYIPGGAYRSEVNTFLIQGGGRNVIVDTGFGTTIFANLKALKVTPEQIDAVLITHMHGDHIGGLQKEGKTLFPKALVYVAQQEYEYWRTGPGPAALAPYGERVRTFLPGELGTAIADLLPGIRAIAAFGHTPGHTVFLVGSAGAQFLIWGDLMHAMDIQFPLPAVSVTYDTDPAQAADTRKAVLEYAAKNRIPVGGMHLVYPAVGFVEAAGNNGYRWVPAK